jgi:transcriptional accessory protein Tex/SPT6
MQWISLISFDETWSSFGLRLQTGKEKKKETKVREIFNYIDPVKKLTFLPEDFAEALQKARKEETVFNSLSFTNRKEYLEWIVSAKKKETRQARILESITRLSYGWKNPSNR